ncbi:unnamed protein product [Plutella xylostella]|uniref:(diamondback moth) hypothetical protein n=1 Tax=Plutella xylostella TaxID=51655 RepID=A0A8S4G4Y9_PLUXY|nr:unnamed protein product [Plutella xylostella]
MIKGAYACAWYVASDNATTRQVSRDARRLARHVRKPAKRTKPPTQGHTMRSLLVLAALLLSSTAAPVAQHSTGPASDHNKTDQPVAELEKLKANNESAADNLHDAGTTGAREHLQYHSVEGVKINDEVVSRLEQHVVGEMSPGESPHVHGHLRLDVPAQGIHKEVIQDGEKVVQHDIAPTTTPSNDEQTTKVFHGAARLVQAGPGTNLPQHTAVRRAFNADITKEMNNNMDHYSSYSGVQYSPLDMAEYVFWTGDERGVTAAVEEFLQEGMMSKEEAIVFLQEIKFNIDYLRAHYAQNVKAEEVAQQEKLRAMLAEQAAAKESYQPYRAPPSLQSFPFASSPDIIRSIASRNWELSNALSPGAPARPVSEMRSEMRSEVKRSAYDPMLQTNILSTSDYDRDGGALVSDEEYSDMMERLRAADSLYTEYTLEEIIYQLAKMMFSQSLSHDPREARAALQRFMAFLELEAERGQLSRSIEKKVLDVMVAALSDTIGDHPELMQAREGTNPGSR